jgi:hypothetical protein
MTTSRIAGSEVRSFSTHSSLALANAIALARAGAATTLRAPRRQWRAVISDYVALPYRVAATHPLLRIAGHVSLARSLTSLLRSRLSSQ